MDKARIIKAWWRVCVVDKRLSAMESCVYNERYERSKRLQGRYWDVALEKLSNEVSKATGVTPVTAEWKDGEMEMVNGKNKVFLRLYTDDPLLVEEVEQKDE